MPTQREQSASRVYCNSQCAWSKAHVLSVNKDRILSPGKVFKQVNHKTYGPDLRFV